MPTEPQPNGPLPPAPGPPGPLPHADEQWVQRLRDGVAPPRWRVAVGAVAVSVVGALLLWAEVTHPGWVRSAADGGGRGSIVVVVPLLLLVSGPVVGVAVWWSGRRDRRTLANVRASGPPPAFHLPVLRSSLRAADELPDPKPELWTVDAEGLHGWVPGVGRAVNLLPWSRVHHIDLATRREKGTDVAYAVWIGTANGHLVLTPRAAIGRPQAATGWKLDAIASILRALRPSAEQETTT